MKRAKILVVEDERIVAEDIRQCLEAVGYEVCGIAKSGDIAMQLADEHLPDLMLMDIVIRGEMDGIETAKAIREKHDIPVVFLTAYSQSGVVERAKAVNPLAYLIKPFDESTLLSTVEVAVHKSGVDAQISESRDLFHTTLMSIGDGVLSTDPEGRVVFMNRVAEELTGWPLSEAVGRSVGEVFKSVNQETGESSEVPCLEAMRLGVVCKQEREGLLRTRDGGEIWIEDLGSPIFNVGGELTGSVLVFRDVSEERESELTLAAYRTKLESMVVERTSELARRIKLESTVTAVGEGLIRSEHGRFGEALRDGVIRLGESDKLVFSAFVCPRGELESIVWREGVMGDAKVSGLLDEFVKGGVESWSSSVQMFSPGGGGMSEEVMAMAVEMEVVSFLRIPLMCDGQVTGFIILGSREAGHWSDDDRRQFAMLASIIQGVNQREREELEKVKLVEELQQARKMEAIGKLSGGIAHDFNNMLVPIIGYSEAILLAGEAGEREDEIAAILKAAKSAADLTKQLLAFSRRQILHRRALDVSQVVDEMLGMVKRILGEDIRVETRFEKPWCVLADSGQLDQVVLNLCINARDAMPKGGVLSIAVENVMVESNQLGRGEKEYVKISVADNGSGMTDEVKARIFDPFFTSKGANGTGLGLSVVQGIVEQHGGWIGLESELGKGSEFSVYLPGDSSAELPMKEVDQVRPVTGVEVPVSARVLLVEDEPGVMMFVSQLLRKRGYDVTAAKCTKEAIDQLDLHRADFDLLFTDAMLPDGTGLDVINHARLIQPGIRILLSSGYTDDRSLVDQAENQSIQFLPKPYTAEGLFGAVDGSLADGLRS